MFMARWLPFRTQGPVRTAAEVHHLFRKTDTMRNGRTILLTLILVLAATTIPHTVLAQAGDIVDVAGVDADGGQANPSVTLSLEGVDTPRSMDSALKIVLLMTVLSLAPAFLVLLTSFTRIVIVLGFLRQAIGANQAPNNQIIIGLALFLTFFVMSPVFTEAYQEGVQPYMDEAIPAELAGPAAAGDSIPSVRKSNFRMCHTADRNPNRCQFRKMGRTSEEPR